LIGDILILFYGNIFLLGGLVDKFSIIRGFIISRKIIKS